MFYCGCIQPRARYDIPTWTSCSTDCIANYYCHYIYIPVEHHSKRDAEALAARNTPSSALTAAVIAAATESSLTGRGLSVDPEAIRGLTCSLLITTHLL